MLSKLMLIEVDSIRLSFAAFSWSKSTTKIKTWKDLIATLATKSTNFLSNRPNSYPSMKIRSFPLEMQPLSKIHINHYRK